MRRSTKDFEMGVWLRTHPSRVREMVQNYAAMRRDGFTIKDALAASHEIEAGLWLEEAA